jgi:S1-C subfamily serine protease
MSWDRSLDIGTIQAAIPPRVRKEERGFLGLFVAPGGAGDSLEPGDEIAPPSLDPTDRLLRWVEAMEPAASAGIRVGDEIVAIGGREVASIGPRAAEILLRYGRIRIGQEFTLDLRRGWRVQSVTRVATALPDELENLLP